MNRNKKLVLGVAAGVTLALGAGGIAFGSIPGTSDNSVTACVTSANGGVRIIDVDAGQVCTSTEKKVSWGGGMRFMGTWTDGPGPGNVPTTWPRVNGYPDVKKGDVVRMEVPTRKFGCTTPKGAWVNVAGSYAYPCLEYPQNWAPLALDGRAAGADILWANLNSAGQITSTNRPELKVYASGMTGATWLNITGFADMRQCSISVTPSDASYDAFGWAYNTGYADWVLVGATKHDGTYAARGLSVVVNCGKPN
jgi:hypothetical protein